jgi:UDPglucose 6-dehydrogenase
VVGADDERAFEALSRLYAPFNRQRNRLQRMSPKSAEIVKYASNALLATKISFMNEIAELCDAAGGDVEQVRLAVGSDERIGMQFLYPGLGFGGSCFPKDLRALVSTGQSLGVKMEVSEAAVRANEGPPEMLLRHMEKDMGGVSGKVIAIWGLAFKPRTDDVREAPALKLIVELVKRGAKIQACDPEALETARESLERGGNMKDVELFKDEYEAVKGADALVIATEWNEYRSPDLPRVKQLMRGRFLFDGRNVVVPGAVVDAGLRYRGIGRPAQG